MHPSIQRIDLAEEPVSPLLQTEQTSVIPAQGLENAPTERHALIVETNPLLRRVLMRILEQAGYATNAANSATHTLSTLEHSAFGVVLLDCDSAEMDGFATASAIRRLEGGARHTPIIALTSNTLPADRRRRKEAGFDNYIEKPFHAEKVRALLARYAPYSSPGSAPDAPPPLLVLDQHQFAELCALATGTPGLVDELVTLFLTGAMQSLLDLRQAEEENRPKRIAQVARSLKSTSGQVGAVRMQAICATIEALAGCGSTAGVGTLLGDLSVAFERAGCDLRSMTIDFLARSSRPLEPTHAAAEAHSGPPEVLLAEDNLLVARFLATNLSAAGFKVTHITGSREALSMLQTGRFQAAIIASGMPELDGYELLSLLRLQAATRTLPLMVISSRHQEEDVLRAFELGADDYVTKPLNPLEVVARIRRLVKGR